MAGTFPTLKDGDGLQPWHLNIVYRELERLRKMSAAPPLAIDNAADDFSPPAFLSFAVDQLIPVKLGVGGIAAGSISAPSSATVTILGSSSGAADVTATSMNTETMYSIYSTAISTAAVCWAAWWNGRLYLVVGDC